MDLSPQQIVTIVQIAGGTGVLAIIVIALVKEWAIPKPAVDRAIKAATDAKDREIKLITEAKDREIEELRRSREQAWELANRNAGSQATQATVIADALGAMVQLAAAQSRAALPPAGAQQAGPMP